MLKLDSQGVKVSLINTAYDVMAAERGVRAHHWGFGDMPGIEGVKKEDVAMIISYVRELQKKAGIF